MHRATIRLAITEVGLGKLVLLMLSLLQHAHAQQARIEIDGSIHVADAEHGVKNAKTGSPIAVSFMARPL